MPIKVVSVRDVYSDVSTQTIKALIAGPPGAGKTRSASTWPDPLYADVEGRLLSIRDRDVPRVRIESVADLEDLKDALDQTPEVRKKLLGGWPVKTLIIDTVDEVARLMQKERLRSEKQEAMRQQDWGWLGDSLRNLLRGFRNLTDLNVVFNVHIKSVEDGETGRVEKRPDISGSVGNEIAAYVDEAFVMVARPTVDPKTGERIVQRYFQTYQDSTFPWVKDHSGTLPMEFPINFEDDYRRLAGFIFGAEATPASRPATKVEPLSAPVTEETKVEDVPPAAVVRRGPAKKKAAARPRAETVVEPVVDTPEPDVEEDTEFDEPPTPVLPAVPEEETAPPAPAPEPEPEEDICVDCGKVIDNPDVAQVSEIRYGVKLCRNDFAARRRPKQEDVA